MSDEPEEHEHEHHPHAFFVGPIPEVIHEAISQQKMVEEDSKNQDYEFFESCSVEALQKLNEFFRGCVNPSYAGYLVGITEYMLRHRPFVDNIPNN